MHAFRLSTLILLALGLALPAAARSRQAPAARADAEQLPVLVDLVLGDAGKIRRMKKTNNEDFVGQAKGELAFSTHAELAALESTLVRIVQKNTGAAPRESLQRRACELKVRAQAPKLDDDDVQDKCRNDRTIGWYLHDAHNPFMRGAMILGLLSGDDVPPSLKKQAMERFVTTLGYRVERYLVKVPDGDGWDEHYRLKKLAPKKWGQTHFRLAWLVHEQMPLARGKTIARLKKAQRKAPKKKCSSYAVVIARDFDGRRYSRPYYAPRMYTGGPGTEEHDVACRKARNKRDRKLLRVLKPDWDGDKLVGAGKVRGARWQVHYEYGRPVYKSKAVRVYVEEDT